jgi:hypothetical protein
MTTRNFLKGLNLESEDLAQCNGKCICHHKHQYCIHNSNKSGCINVMHKFKTRSNQQGKLQNKCQNEQNKETNKHEHNDPKYNKLKMV